MRSIIRIWQLACKDWKLFLLDRQAVLLCFAAPIVLASLFGAIFHRSGKEAQPKLLLFVVASGNDTTTTGVLNSLKANPQIDVRRASRQAAFAQMENDEKGVVVILPEHWTQDKDERPHVCIHHAPTRPHQGKWAEGLLTQAYFQQYARQWAPQALRRPFEVSHLPIPGAQSITDHAYAHSYCGMTLQYLLFWGMDSGLLLLRERRRGIWKRMRCSPVSLWSLVLAKMLSISMIALAQIAVTFTFGAWVHGVPIGSSWTGFVILAITAALLSATIGLFIASLAGTESRARSLSIVTVLGLSLLGGLWLPAYFMPEWVQRLGIILPTSWAAKGFSAMTWQGLGFRAALPSVLVLLSFSLVLLLIALWRFRQSDARVLLRGE